MAVQRRDRPAGRPLKGVPSLPSAPRPARPPAWPAGPVVPGPKVLPLVLGPALLTLGVTLLRLVGELRGWSPEHFSRLPGGGLAVVGVSWLPPLVGAYFGWRLTRAGVPSPSLVQLAAWPAAALFLSLLLGFGLEELLQPSWTRTLALWAMVAVPVAIASFIAWPALGRLLLTYAVAARVPVAVVMALAIWKGWGTHYDAPPPGFPVLPPLKRWLWIGLLPQGTIWIAWSMATGALGDALRRAATSLWRGRQSLRRRLL